MSEYINKIIIPTLDGECELSLDHKANVDDVYKKNETYNKEEVYNKNESYVELSWTEYVDLASNNKLSNNTTYSVPDVGLYIGKRAVWEVVDDCLPKNGIIMGRFTSDSNNTSFKKWIVYLNEKSFNLTKYTNPFTKQFYLDLNNMPSDWTGGEITKIRFGTSNTNNGANSSCEAYKIILVSLSSKMSDISYMFTNCHNLEEVYLDKNYSITIQNAKGFTLYCSSLKKFVLSGSYASELLKYVKDRSYVWGIRDLSVVSDMLVINVTNVCTNLSNYLSYCYSFNYSGTSGYSWITTGVTDMSYLFRCCSSLVTLEKFCSMGNFDTSKVTDMSGMFFMCESLQFIQNFINRFDTSKVTSMYSMFDRCYSLTTLDLSNFDTSSVTNMGSMFSGCTGLTTLDLSSFDTSKVTTMGSMFYGCSLLTTLDLSNFDTSNVTYMSSMFSGCTGLTTLDLSSFDTSKVTTMGSMFRDCTSLTTLDLSNFDTSSVTEMQWMFKGCSSLTTLDLSNFDTSNLTSMNSMFDGCKSLTTLDLSNFDTSKVTYMDYIFRDCTSLTTVTGSITGIKKFLDLSDSPLTVDSAMVFINGLSEVTSTTTLKLKSTTYDLLTPEQRAIATSKGWNVTRS